MCSHAARSGGHAFKDHVIRMQPHTVLRRPPVILKAALPSGLILERRLCATLWIAQSRRRLKHVGGEALGWAPPPKCANDILSKSERGVCGAG